MKTWKPKNKEWYWSIHRILPHMKYRRDAIVAHPYIWSGDDDDLLARRYGNVFKTKKQALNAGKAMLKALKTYEQ